MIYPMIQQPGPRCVDCGATPDVCDLVLRGDSWWCEDDAGCIERTYARYGGALRAVTDPASVTPRDGETLGAFEYRAYFEQWVYTAGYHDPCACERRAESLTRGHHVPFFVTMMPDGKYYAVTTVEHTAALRGSLRPLASALAWDESDTEAHVRETVDELAREV